MLEVIQPLKFMWDMTTKWQKLYPPVVSLPFSEIIYSDIEIFLNKWVEDFVRLEKDEQLLPCSAA